MVSLSFGLPLLLVVLALCMVGMTLFRSNVLLYSAQSAVLGILATVIGRGRGEPLLALVGCAILVLKGAAVPLYLTYAARKIGSRRDVGQIIAPPLQIFLALGGLVILALTHPFRNELPESALPAVSILLLGMLIMLTRRLAISQIIGFLVIENGIFLFTISQPHSMPLVVEIGVLMDVLAGTMLAGVLAFHINRTFEHIDVSELKDLRG